MTIEGYGVPALTNIENTIRRLQWANLAKKPRGYDLDVVYEFYKRLGERDSIGYVLVKGRKVLYTVDSINSFLGCQSEADGNEVVYEHTNNSNDYFTAEMSGFLVHDGLLIVNNGRPVQREEQRTSLKKTWLKAEVRVWVQWVSYNLMPTQHFQTLTPPMG